MPNYWMVKVREDESHQEKKKKKQVVGNILQPACQPRTPLCSDTWPCSSSFSLPSNVQGRKQKKGTTWLQYSWSSIFILLVSVMSWEGRALWSGRAWINRGQCGQVCLFFPVLLFSLCFLDGDRLHCPAQYQQGFRGAEIVQGAILIEHRENRNIQRAKGM